MASMTRFAPGNIVVFRKHHSSSNLRPGDRGVVERLSTLYHDAYEVRFQAKSSHAKVVIVYPEHMEHESSYLRRLGFQQGQRVFSTIVFSGSGLKLVPGTAGVVEGASEDNTDGERLLVKFRNAYLDFQNVNMLPTQISANDPVRQISASDPDLFYRREMDAIDARLGSMKIESHNDLATSKISLISHTHGRERREQRDIQRRELQEAIKYGRKEIAHPGRDGSRRWKYIHRDIVYVTDEYSRHEITSWRHSSQGAAADADEEDLGNAVPAGPVGSHTVIVVDHSGSMRKGDVPGFDTRTAAVYECLGKEFIRPQLDNPREQDGGSVVTLVEMSDTAKVTLSRHPIDDSLHEAIKQRKRSRARSHGNYLSALDAVERVLEPEVSTSSHLLVVFLSDGAPSDHTQMECEHGVQVWQEHPSGARRANGKVKLNNCPRSFQCRSALRTFVEEECVRRVTKLGDRFGRDRLFLATVAFGPPSDDYTVLANMASALPRSEFQKLGLSASGLRTALTSFSSTLTTLRTDCSTGSLTERKKEKTDANQEATTIPSHLGDPSNRIIDAKQWAVYAQEDSVMIATPPFREHYNVYGRALISKKKWDARKKAWVLADMLYGSTGLAFMMKYFAEGAERLCYRCCEINDYGEVNGPPVVAKESRFEEYLSHKYHDNFARTQGEAQELALNFNGRVAGPSAWTIFFVPCFLYTVYDNGYPSSVAWALVEQELEGKYTKWNNNGGSVRKNKNGNDSGSRSGGLLAIAEGDSDEEESDEDGPSGGGSEVEVDINDVPQCFSHFTYSITNGKQLVCDLQGVWNAVDGFTLTDPVIHYNSSNRRHVNGATDKGKGGMEKFFSTHKCNALCRRLGLSMPDPSIFQ